MEGNGGLPPGYGFGPSQAPYFQGTAERWQKEADRDYQLKKTAADQQYKSAMMSARTQADAQRATAEYQRAQVELAKDRLSFDRDSFVQKLAWDKEQFGQTHSLNQAKLGYDLLGTAAQLRGPSDYFAAANYARGVAGNPQTSAFLSALQKNTALPAYGMQGGQPERETIGTMLGKLQGQGVPNTENYLAQIGNVAAKGAHQLGSGALEGLTGTERELFSSGLGELGYDTSTFLDQYRRSRVNQGIGADRAA